MEKALNQDCPGLHSDIFLSIYYGEQPNDNEESTRSVVIEEGEKRGAGAFHKVGDVLDEKARVVRKRKKHFRSPKDDKFTKTVEKRTKLGQRR